MEAPADVYRRLAEHVSTLGMGLPLAPGLEEILAANFSPREAEVALALPTRVAPMQVVAVDDIAARVDIPRGELATILEGLARRGVIFSGKTKDGGTGYALLQLGHGFPQTFFWSGQETPHGQNMAKLVARYLNRSMILPAYGGSATKPFRYIPVGKTIDTSTQAVYPYDLMEKVIGGARVIAVAHCPCRMMAKMRGKGCYHPLEVCFKYDELAEYVIANGLAREITKAEALRITRQAEDMGLVHFVDNARHGIKHTCHCCGCACWAVGGIRRRLAPRDMMMATYYLRYTDREKCISCEACVAECPVQALTMVDGYPVLAEEWCIGCGVCVSLCATGAAKLKPRGDRTPPGDFGELYRTILKEKGLS